MGLMTMEAEEERACVPLAASLSGEIGWKRPILLLIRSLGGTFGGEKAS